MIAFVLKLAASLPALAALSLTVVSAEKINVHVVPHTHDDVGWLKTVDEYYIGANNSIQHAGVQYILDTVVQELQKNPDRTFIYVEIAFFMRWWRQQDDKTKDIVRNLVTTTKQLEFINAGWCMNDEAATDYNAIIDQMSIGLRFVEENFGPTARPRIGWHIDPFGHSAEQAALFAKMGFDGFFFARIDYADKNKRQADKTLEMVWQPSTSLGAEADIFTGVLYYGYGPPPGFCWDVRCSDTPIQDDPNLFDYNVEERVGTFVKAVIDQSSHYATNNIMFTMGSDFQYENAHEWYKNLDKLIHYVNKLSGDQVNVFYSTPSRYVDAVHAANKTWTVKNDDFFPYADNPYAYWTGYFTSRPALKRYTREMNTLLQSCKYFEASGSNLPLVTKSSSVPLQRAMGVDQHHDAVSGTEKQHVADDYAKRLHIGQVACQALIGEVLGAFAATKSQAKPLTGFQFCEYLNISVCPASESDSVNAVIFNPLGRETLWTFTMPVQTEQLSVVDDAGKPVQFQILPVSNATKAVRRDKGDAPYMLLWMTLVPASGYKMYFIRPSNKTTKVSEEEVPQGKADIVIGNPVMSVTFDGTTGRMKSIDNKLSKVTAMVDQQFLFWNSSAGNNVNSSQASGAYIFRPNGTAPYEVNPGNTASITVINGSVVQEVRQVFTSWASQVVRLYNGIPLVELEFTIGPIPFKDVEKYGGREVVSRFSTDIDNAGVWYTDANGREMQRRERNFRPTWKLNVTEPVAGNYFPVNSRIYLRSSSKDVQFTVLTDRSQGGASLNDGQLELMVHRRCFHDDHRGVGEHLNETGQYGDGLIIRGKHIVLLDNVVNSTYFHRLLGEMLMREPVYAFLPNTMSYDDFVKDYYTVFTGLTKDLPYNVHLLTLEWLQKNKFLLRLEHQYEAEELPYNNTVTLQLDEMFSNFKVTEVTKLVLGGNAALSDVHRLSWNTEQDSRSMLSSKKEHDQFTVVLKPMEIHTFNITVEYP